MPLTSTFQCSTCGSILLAGERFCGRCGAPTTDAGSPPTLVDGQGNSPWDAILRQLRASTLGEFEIKRELGRGGMAAVYLAHEIALNRKVALKVMAPGLMLGEGMVERFRFEAVTIANLSHPHIVRIHAVRQAAEMHFFVMQYLAGRSLERIVRTNGPLPIPVVRTLLSQVGSALGYAHRRGVIHRDIKPANILFDSTGDAIVTDFGIAKVAEEPSQTLAGSVVGTPSYMSPEQCYARELTGASDQYSLGIVAFEMLTGSAPFLGPAYTVMQGHTHGEIPTISVLRSDCPPDLEAAVLRMLARKPEDRFPSLAEAVRAIGTIPLAEHDALREELVTLAAVEENAALDAAVPTPMSPIPQMRSSSPAKLTPAIGTPQQTPRIGVAPVDAPLAPIVQMPLAPADRTMVDAAVLREEGTAGLAPPARGQPPTTRRWLLAIPAVAIAGALVVFLTRGGDQPAPSPAPALVNGTNQSQARDPIAGPAPDSIAPTVVDSTNAAVPTPARGTTPATKAPVEPPPAPPGRAIDRAQASVKPSVTGPAVVRTPIPAPIETTRIPAPLQTSAPPPEPAPRPPERPAKSAAELRSELDAIFRAFARAIESRDLGRVRTAFPAIQQSQLDAYADFFEIARNVKINIDGGVVRDALTATAGSEARASVDYTIQYRSNSLRRDVSESSQWQAVLLRTANGWRLLSLR